MKNYMMNRDNNVFDAFSDLFRPMTNFQKFSDMKTDIKENDKEYEFDVELPGFKKDEINVQLEDGELTISAQKRQESEQGNNNNQNNNQNNGQNSQNTQEQNKQDPNKKVYIKRERCYSLSRTFYVGDVDKQSIKAKYENGLLTLNVPKENEKKVETNKIEIE
jgi:HSP20 family protein